MLHCVVQYRVQYLSKLYLKSTVTHVLLNLIEKKNHNKKRYNTYHQKGDGVMCISKLPADRVITE